MSKNILVMTVKIPMLISQEATVHTLNDDMALERLKGKLLEIVSSELKHSLDYRKARVDDSITLAKYLHNKTEQDVLDEIARVEKSHKEILQRLAKCKLKIGNSHFDAVFVEIGECELV